MQVSVSPSQLRALCASVRAIPPQTPGHLLRDLADSMAGAEGMLDGLPEQALTAPGASYTRHVAYADPLGRYTVVYLVWPPGQFSPIHGHKTWCAYRVLKGELTETHYRWNPAAGRAAVSGSVRRRAGDIVTAEPGLGQIHRLGNAGNDAAVSLHVYGVNESDIASGVNLLVEADAPDQAAESGSLIRRGASLPPLISPSTG